LDALLDPVVRGRVVDRLDLAALQVGNDQLQRSRRPSMSSMASASSRTQSSSADWDMV
jgi:hypothetical protein